MLLLVSWYLLSIDEFSMFTAMFTLDDTTDELTIIWITVRITIRITVRFIKNSNFLFVSLVTLRFTVIIGEDVVMDSFGELDLEKWVYSG